MDVAELVFLREEESLLHLRLDRAEICVGSNPTNDVVVPDSSVPDVAALLIDRGAHRYRLRVLAPGHLFLNGKAIDEDEIDLGAGDTLGIGPYRLRLQVRDDHADAQQRHRNTRLLSDAPRKEGRAALTFGGKKISVEGDRPFNIGSHEDNDLIIDDGFVSTFHCRITQRDGRWLLVDVGSTNGTEVNGLRVKEAELPSPATIKLGKAVVSFAAAAPEARKSRRPKKAPKTFGGMLAESPQMTEVFELIERVCDAKEPVLVIGESGCGKELVARALHDESPRASGPFLAINCGALSSHLVESELFGHVRGAFTGAVADKEGAFEATSGGTLFLDEIGELPFELQPKLLRVLETSTVRRVGGTKEVPVDTRIVAATHRNLEELVDEGMFREDLFHRLFVLSVTIPPLRDRPSDILPLAERFLDQAPKKKALSDDACAALTEYSWPGNVRELRNVIVRALVMTRGDAITAADLQFSRDAFAAGARNARQRVRRLDEEERQKLIEALDKTGGNRAEAARLLGVSKSTFHDRLRRYGISSRLGGRP